MGNGQFMRRSGT